MTTESGMGAEPYLVGGNLLNEDENVAKAKESHDAGKDPAERIAEVAGTGKDDTGTGSASDETGNDPTEGGTKIPEQDADSITDEQLTHGGGAVPPGSMDSGNARPRGTAKDLDY